VVPTVEREAEPITGLRGLRDWTLERTQPQSSGVFRQQWRDDAALLSEYSGGAWELGRFEKRGKVNAELR
jgi:hypothetical protein